ncbi:MAG: hypothetical protein MR006_03785 [Arcanobacterium sp.]|nr:hypothetical protein [Arcanobacterium sp.]MDY5588843.1 hypothetical protein [Arcanobacterium sp.]
MEGAENPTRNPDGLKLGHAEKSDEINHAICNVPDALFPTVESFIFEADLPVQRCCTIEWAAQSNGDDDSLILISVFRANGEVLLPLEEFSIHPELGSYLYAVSDASTNEEVRHSVIVHFPEEATRIVLRGKTWKGKGAFFTSTPTLTPLNNESVALKNPIRWLQNLDRSANVLVIYTTSGSLLPTVGEPSSRSSRIAFYMAAQGWNVVYVPYSSEEDDFQISGHDRILQISSKNFIRYCDELLAIRPEGKKVFLCSSRADLQALKVQDLFRAASWKIVYEMRDEIEEFQKVSYFQWYRPLFEQRFASHANLILATDKKLLQKLVFCHKSPTLRVLPNAASDYLIDAARSLRTIQNFAENRTERIVGYLGNPIYLWLYWKELVDLAQHKPDVTFQIVSQKLPLNLVMPPNLEYVGDLTDERALESMAHWRVGIVPFARSRLTHTLVSHKAYDYVSLGVQILSTPLSDVMDMPGMHIYRDTEGLEKVLEDALSFIPTDNFYEKCEQYLLKNTWQNRLNNFSEEVEGLFR